MGFRKEGKGRGNHVSNSGFHELENYTWMTIMCLDDELSSTMSWVELSWLVTKYSELFILLAENSQFLLKIYVIQIFLAFIYLVAQSLVLNNQLNSSLRQIIDSLVLLQKIFYRTDGTCSFKFLTQALDLCNISEVE